MYPPNGSSGLLGLIDGGFRLYQMVLLVRILCSWFPIDRRSQWYSYLYRATEPFLAPFRQILPPASGIDFSPIAAFFALDILRMMIFRVL